MGCPARLIWLWPRYDYAPEVQPPFAAQRVAGNPIISGELDPALSANSSEGGYVNIAGPSVIRVPDWIANPLGHYYLYFAHHKGNHIRLAYADSPTGPWTLYQPGVLSLAQSGMPVDRAALGPSTSLRDLQGTFSTSVMRDYLLISYRACCTGLIGPVRVLCPGIRSCLTTTCVTMRFG
jgi:hypothetical protein